MAVDGGERQRIALGKAQHAVEPNANSGNQRRYERSQLVLDLSTQPSQAESRESNARLPGLVSAVSDRGFLNVLGMLKSYIEKTL